MNVKRSTLLVLAFFLLFLGTSCSEKNEKNTVKKTQPQPVSSRIIDENILENISVLHEGIKFSPSPNGSAFDNDGNMYYRDKENHRFLKISNKGKFAGQLGEKGENLKNLYNPDSIFIKDNMIYILDHFGQKIKHFCPDGSFRYQFLLDDIELVYSLFVDENYIYLNAMYHNPKTYRQRKLVTILSKEDGKKISEVGELIETRDAFGYYIFNRSFITVRKDQIFIAFKFLPLLVGYDMKGNEILRIDLEKKNMPDIRTLAKAAKQKGLDTNKTAGGPTGRAKIYCDGFAADANGDFYYSIKKSFYRFDSEFNLKTRYMLPRKETASICLAVITDNNGDAWGLVAKAGHIYRFKFSKI